MPPPSTSENTTDASTSIVGASASPYPCATTSHSIGGEHILVRRSLVTRRLPRRSSTVLRLRDPVRRTAGAPRELAGLGADRPAGERVLHEHAIANHEHTVDQHMG